MAAPAFGLLCVGRGVQTDYQTIDDARVVFTIPDVNHVKHVTVFMTGTIQLPPGYGAAVYFLWLGEDGTMSSKYLGFIANEKPSALFRLSKFHHASPSAGQEAFVAGLAPPLSSSAQIGVSLEAMETINSYSPDPAQLAENQPAEKEQQRFRPCRNPFFSGFLAYRESDDWLEFSSEMPNTESHKRLYIRSAYKEIAQNALLKTDPHRKKYAVITGTPGIGKTVFGYYVFWRLVKDKKRVLYVQKGASIYFDGNSLLECPKLPDAYDQFWAPNLWCIIDSSDPIELLGRPRINDCSVLLVTTMRRDYMSEFLKLEPEPTVFYMPIWTREELEKIQCLFPGQASVWQERFEHLGGVPRYVFVTIRDKPEEVLRKACGSCSLEDCITVVSLDTAISEKTKVAQKLIHIHSTSPYTECEVRYATQSAVSMIVATKCGSDRHKMQSLLSSCAESPLAAALCGYIFEPYALDMLEKGGQFSCRELVHGNAAKRPTQPIDVPKSPQSRQYVDQVETDQTADQLYVPRSPNFVAIDAWIPGFGGFQITVGKSHSINGSASNVLKKLGPKGNRLFFLLPPQYFDSFTKKTPQNIEQYAILIPYPETAVFPSVQ